MGGVTRNFFSSERSELHSDGYGVGMTGTPAKEKEKTVLPGVHSDSRVLWKTTSGNRSWVCASRQVPSAR